MFAIRAIVAVYALRHKNLQIFLSPCRHISNMIIRLEMLGSFPSCRMSTVSIAPANQPLLFTAKCHRCCSKSVSKSQVFWIMVPTRIFLILTNSLAPVTGEFCLVILPPLFDVYEIDRSGYGVVAHHLYRHIILQEAMSWLSTLGGGFSSLGDKFEDAVRHSYIHPFIILQPFSITPSDIFKLVQTTFLLFHYQGGNCWRNISASDVLGSFNENSCLSSSL